MQTKNDTTKPEAAPQQETGGDCPSTSCCASFEREYLGMPYTPTKEEIRMRELAQEYHRTCEDYDRTVCTGEMKDGAIMPATGAEVSAISRHAQAVRDGLWKHVAPLGFSRQQWMEAIRDEGRHYRHNVKEHAPSPAAACSDPQPATEHPDQPENKAAGEGRVSRLVRCSSFWVLDSEALNLVKSKEAPVIIGLCESWANAFKSIPEDIRPRAILVSSGGGYHHALLDVFEMYGVPAVRFDLRVRSYDPQTNSMAKKDSFLVDDVVVHLDNLVSVARNNWIRRKVDAVDKLSGGEVEKGSV